MRNAEFAMRNLIKNSECKIKNDGKMFQRLNIMRNAEFVMRNYGNMFL